MRRVFRHTIPCLLAFAVLIKQVPGVAAQDISKVLEDRYQNKILVLRNFYAGNSLRFASNGKLLSKPVSDDWTTDGFVQIDEIKASGQSLQIRATRLQLGWFPKSGFTVLNKRDSKGGLDKKEKKSHELQIQADMDTLAPQPADALLSQIFLTGTDSFANAVPSYWKLCVHDGLLGSTKPSQACGFSTELLDVPSLRTPASNAPPSSGIQGERLLPLLKVSKIEKGVDSPPHAIYSPEPPFTDAAHARRFQGTVILSLGVDERGHTKDIQITGPLGCGLDAQAVRAVEEWRFIPARKNGSDVSFQLAVELDFHLY